MATVYRRGKIWWGRVQRDGVDLRKSLETPVERIARSRLTKWIDGLTGADWGDKPRRTFDDAMLKFIDEHLPTLKPKSRRRYLSSIEALTDEFEGDYLDQIGSARLSDFETNRRRAGAREPERLKGKMKPRAITAATIRRDLACLSSMFGSCMEWEWVTVNPVPAFLKARKKKGLRESAPRTRFLSLDEEKRLLAECLLPTTVANCPDLYDTVCVAIDTGLREDEEFGLRRHQLDHIAKRVKTLESTSKNSKAREVPLLARSAEILRRRPLHNRTDFVFVNRETMTRYTHLNRALKGAAKRAGIVDLTWHDLRRTCGCRLLQEHGMSMEQVSKWLGHSSVTVTERHYAFLFVDNLEQHLKKVGAA